MTGGDVPMTAARLPARADTGAEDAALMRRLADGDMSALGQLVRRHQDRVRAVAYRMTLHWDMADDIAQEAFLRVYRAAPGYQPSASFSTWLYRIVVNLCLDAAKKPKPVALADDAPSGVAPDPRSPAPSRGDGAAADALLIEQEKLAAVRRAVAALPDRQRMAVVLHRFEGLDHAHIAETTGWSVSAVESLLVRAYAQLRQQLGQWQDEA